MKAIRIRRSDSPINREVYARMRRAQPTSAIRRLIKIGGLFTLSFCVYVLLLTCVRLFVAMTPEQITETLAYGSIGILAVAILYAARKSV